MAPFSMQRENLENWGKAADALLLEGWTKVIVMPEQCLRGFKSCEVEVNDLIPFVSGESPIEFTFRKRNKCAWKKPVPVNGVFVFVDAVIVCCDRVRSPKVLMSKSYAAVRLSTLVFLLGLLSATYSIPWFLFSFQPRRRNCRHFIYQTN